MRSLFDVDRRELEPDARAEAWYQLLVDIDDLLATGRYTWAEDLLRGIQETVRQTAQVTPRQRQAVANIEHNPR